jgi:anti-anti-sigma factor
LATIEPAIVRVCGDVTFLDRDRLQEQLRPIADAGVAIVDFSDASYVDSSVISQLLACNRARLTSGRAPLRLVVGPGVARIFDVAGMRALMATFDTLEDAARS